MRDPKRTLMLNLRRRVKVSTRQHAVAHDVEARTITYRCRECGTDETKSQPSEHATRLHYHWHHEDRGGCVGSCARCLKSKRDRLYPLPAPQKK